MDIVIVFAAGWIGMFIGLISARVVLFRKASGTLRVDTSDMDDGPHLFLELSEDVRKVAKKEYIMFKVKKENFLSQK